MIVREIDWRSPIDAFQPLAGEPFSILLHAGEEARHAGWSTIAAFPSATLEMRRSATFVNGELSSRAPFSALRDLADGRRGLAEPGGWSLNLPPPPMMAGLAGFAGYEAGCELEPSAAGPPSPFLLPDLAFGAYDACAVFNRRIERAFVCAYTDEAADRLSARLGREAAPSAALPDFGPVASNFSREAYERAVAAAIELIREGALFQANLAQQLHADAKGELDAFSLYRRIAAGDAPFAAFLNFREGVIVSNSPERFFRVAEERGARRIVAEPIKGTRPRSRDAREDRVLAEDLLADPKERAENVMIADLTRNDLSRISAAGSIREDEICALQSFSHIHHLVSRISGELRDDVTAVDALAALFPCGSVTGAPKIEAMKTIAAMEGIGRGPYCGAIGYIDDRGLADFSVAIRTMMVTQTEGGARVTIPVGGGVTLRSEPSLEYEETLHKARAALSALGLEPEP